MGTWTESFACMTGDISTLSSLIKSWDLDQLYLRCRLPAESPHPQDDALARPDEDVMETKINRPQVNFKKFYQRTLKESPNNSISGDLTNREISDWAKSQQHICQSSLFGEKNQDPGNPKPPEYFPAHKQPPQSGGSEWK